MPRCYDIEPDYKAQRDTLLAAVEDSLRDCMAARWVTVPGKSAEGRKALSVFDRIEKRLETAIKQTKENT